MTAGHTQFHGGKLQEAKGAGSEEGGGWAGVGGRIGGRSWWLDHGCFFPSSIFQIILFYYFYKKQISHHVVTKTEGEAGGILQPPAEPAGPSHAPRGRGQLPQRPRAPPWQHCAGFSASWRVPGVVCYRGWGSEGRDPAQSQLCVSFLLMAWAEGSGLQALALGSPQT